ncbi:hypothetical protein B296_00012214 [Ensete ventricosum]|uniref:Uncharacterized protein n=1 Tax=Ensete ventricosum TaxID=4639 RepID=A0A426ZHY4_ENSVE|nr:hypothetical protein B296_00012214 [Ensete ventricosum]
MAPNIPRRREDDLGCASWNPESKSTTTGKRGGGDRGGDENRAEHDQQWRPHREADDGGRQHRPTGRGRRHSHYHRVPHRVPLPLLLLRKQRHQNEVSLASSRLAEERSRGREGEEADGVAYLPGDGLKARDDATTVVDKSAAVALAAVEGKGLAGEIPAETARGATAVTVRGGRHGHQPLEYGDDVVQVGGQLSEAMVLDELYRCQQHESFTNAGSYV